MSNSDRIANGKVAKTPIPWVVALWVPGNGTSICTGALIDQRTVLTARHCILENPKEQGKLLEYYVKGGSTHTNSSVIIPVKRIILANDKLYLEENFEEVGRNDMAILKLAAPLILPNVIQPICLPDNNFKYKPGKECFISGWGQTSEGNF